MRGRTWTAADVEAVRVACGRGEALAVTARRMCRSQMSLHQIRHRLGLRSVIRKGSPLWYRRSGLAEVEVGRVDWAAPDRDLIAATGLSCRTITRIRRRLGIKARRFEHG